MLIKKELKKPILALILLSLGGWIFHFRIHPISENPSYSIPFIFGIVNIIITPLLLNYKKTVVIGYLINGFGVIIGTITMAHLSISGLPQQLTFTGIIFKTTLSDIFILLPKLLIGHVILLHFYPTGMGRMFTPSWWVRHFAYLTIIYSLGHSLWR